MPTKKHEIYVQLTAIITVQLTQKPRTHDFSSQNTQLYFIKEEKFNRNPNAKTH